MLNSLGHRRQTGAAGRLAGFPFAPLLLVLAFTDCTCGGVVPCEANRVLACPCPDGRESYQTCNPDGVGFSECACDAAPDPIVDLTVAPVTRAIYADNMAPGDEVVESIDVANRGNVELRYSVSLEHSGDPLTTQLQISFESSTSRDCEDITEVLFGPRALAQANGPVVGDPSPGFQSGDRVLKDGVSEYLCVRVALPLETPSEYQGTSASFGLAFGAEETSDD